MSLLEYTLAAPRRREGQPWQPRLPGLLLSAATDLPVFLLFGLLIVLPLASVLAQAMVPGLFDPRAPSWAIDISPLRRALGTPRIWASIFHSVELGATVALTATLVGGLFAVMTLRFRLPLRWLWAPVPWLVFLTPAYLKALAWVLLMSPGGYLAQLGILPHWGSEAFFGLCGLVFVHTLSLFPLPAFIIGSALTGLGQEMEEAARLFGSGPWRIWAQVLLPLILPAIMLSMIAVFAEVLSDFGLAATIAHTAGFGVLTYGIYAAASDYPVDFPMAGAQAIILLSIILIVALADRLLRKQSPLRLVSGRSRGRSRQETGMLTAWILTGSVLAFSLLALWLPLCTVMLRAATATLGHGLDAGNFTSDNIADVLTPNSVAFLSLLRSFIYAAITAVVAVAVALVLASRLDRSSASVRAWVTGLSLGAVAIPGIVLAFGYILVWNGMPFFRGWPLPRYGDASLLITGYVAASLPYCLIVIMTAVGQLAPSLTDAARLHGHGRLRRITRITLPLVMVAVVTALALTFIRTVFELPISQLLVPQTGSPVPPYVVRLLGHDEDGLASALALVCMLGSGLIAGGAWALARRHLSFGTPEAST